MASKHVKHILTIALLVVMVSYASLNAGVCPSSTDPIWDLDPISEYGIILTVFLYVFKFVSVFGVPLTIGNLLGLMMYNLYPDPPTLKGSPLLAPFICFRVVTKGDFPKLVRDNIVKNMETCVNAGLENFMFEVVTDKAINLPKRLGTREVLVPNSYCTSQGSLFKARALQFCLEDGVNMLNDEDWIVHLDEETLLTENAVKGMFNFVTEGRHQFGQGVITYASGTVVNWFTTLIDSVRVGLDYGALRFTFKCLHRPVLNWKGSYNVSNVGAERRVNYDHGPGASVAEDCYFGILAHSMGYSFGFVEGELHEQSTFTLMDYIRQRRRWVQGIYLACKTCSVPLQFRVGIFFMVAAMVTLPIMTVGIPLSVVYPVPMFRPFNVVCALPGGTFVFLYFFGAMKSLSARKFGVIKYFLLCFCTLLLIPLSVILENAAVLSAACSQKINFHIVKKEIKPSIEYGERSASLA